MGPTILFDKSFLQSLSLDECIWLDHFFYSNICPIFYVETLSDLSKDTKTRTPEDEVRIIADKTPTKHGYPNLFHTDLCIDELHGNKIIMDGRPIIPPGKSLIFENKTAHVSELPPEMEAFIRWQEGNFKEVERITASVWRNSIKSMNFDIFEEYVKPLNIKLEKCDSLEESKKTAESIVNGRDQIYNRLNLFLKLLAIPSEFFETIYLRWISNKVPPLKLYAPYTAHVLTLDIFFYIAVFSGLISSKKVTNRIDLAYLFYLPFCNIFTSSDNFHKMCIPLFLNENQLFLWGPDLKSGLREVDHFYDKFPDSEKEKGLYEIAPFPPLDDKFLVRQIWDDCLEKHKKNYKAKPRQRKSKDQNTNIPNYETIKHINELVDTAKELSKSDTIKHIENPDEIVIKRKTAKKKGKWWILPKDLETK